jgi:hypothetical protein
MSGISITGGNNTIINIEPPQTGLGGSQQGGGQGIQALLQEVEQELQQLTGGSGSAPSCGTPPSTGGLGGASAATQAFGNSAQMSPQFQSAFNQWAAKDPGGAQQFASAVSAGNTGSDEMKNVEGFLESAVKNGTLSGSQAEALASGGPASGWAGGTLGRDVASNVATGTTNAYGNTMVSELGAQASGLMGS